MDRAISINQNFLIAIYLVAPILGVILLIDYYFFGAYIKNLLPNSPNWWGLFILVFFFPHAIASAFSFADKEYFTAYKKPLVYGLPVIIVAVLLIPFFIGWEVIFLMNLLFSSYHLYGQLTGVTKLLMRNIGFFYFAWRYSVLAFFMLAYVVLFVPDFFGVDFRTYLNPLIYFFAPVVLAFNILALKNSKTKKGAIYLWANFFLFVLALSYYIAGYYFFTFLALVLVHDITAFAFYIAHDHNRNIGEIKNYFYKLFHFTKIPIFILCPLLSFLMAYLLREYSAIYLVSSVVYFFWFFHYYSELFMWKYGTVHRQYISLS
ncbi:MAG: hypothetical protein COT81_04885 [Candidatus Buchananbacteria bacterium CG10_big_fil_rev_8_21_14_0_10_42_9]|uniref:Uncharacterized protein n=1 Tax=Candidatus Buchananbacteria bacterium CG10_big_fil_rev_8_21_14_0_10_42_9 TaxID=1974526 RepID=A0A2H0W028_9BACT|nr:MAG: hypothetical protein COT81_04885 [Candidatus Buchananbacteria bacterium CG10_big_fil_rev_8_21_14_0_10_42_9]